MPKVFSASTFVQTALTCHSEEAKRPKNFEKAGFCAALNNDKFIEYEVLH
jgi:hypothetical protein